MTQEIRRMYESAGLEAPEGKGLHTKEAHACVIAYLKKGLSKDEAWKRCMGGLGRDRAVKKSHWRAPQDSRWRDLKDKARSHAAARMAGRK